MKTILWTVSYKENGQEKKISAYSKKAIVHEYLDILDRPFNRGVSELRIYKGNADYTATLNRFLCGR